MKTLKLLPVTDIPESQLLTEQLSLRTTQRLAEKFFHYQRHKERAIGEIGELEMQSSQHTPGLMTHK